MESKLFHPKIVGIEDKIKAANVQTTINTQEVDKKEKTASRIRGSVDAVKELARGISEMGRQIGGVRRQYR